MLFILSIQTFCSNWQLFTIDPNVVPQYQFQQYAKGQTCRQGRHDYMRKSAATRSASANFNYYQYFVIQNKCTIKVIQTNKRKSRIYKKISKHRKFIQYRINGLNIVITLIILGNSERQKVCDGCDVPGRGLNRYCIHSRRSARPRHNVSARTSRSISFFHSIPSEMTRSHSLQTSSADLRDSASRQERMHSAMWSSPFSVK